MSKWNDNCMSLYQEEFNMSLIYENQVEELLKEKRDSSKKAKVQEELISSLRKVN